MSWLCDTTELVPAGWLSSRYAGHGVLAENIPSTGIDGPSALFGAITLPADNGKEIRGYITRWPAAPLGIDEDGAFTYGGSPDYFDFALYADGIADTTDIGFGPGISRIFLGMDAGGAFTGMVTLDGIIISGSFSGSAPTQFSRPISDVSAGGWTPSTGSDLWPMLDETSASDSDYIETATASTATVGLSTPTYPGGAVQTLSVRAASDDGSTLTVRLKQGATLIATRTQVLTSTYTTYNWTLDAGEIALITAGPFTLDVETS